MKQDHQTDFSFQKKSHRAKYVDHDMMNDDYPMYGEGEWPGYGPGQSPRGPYDSPGGSNSDEYGDTWAKANRKRGDKYDRPPPGPYDSPYDSPPGVYDSPSDDEYGPPPKLKR